MYSLTVIVPVLNESQLLPDFLRITVGDLEGGGLDWELILVDDGSTDGSREIMEAFAADRGRVRVIALERNVGPGANLHEAYRRSTKQFACYATVDRFYDTKLLAGLMEQMAGYDGINAFRTDLTAHPPLRRVQTMANVCLNRILFPRHRFKAYHTLQIHRTDFLRSAGLEARTPFLCTEMLLKAKALGLRIREVGIPFLPRPAGKATGGSPRLIVRHVSEMFGFWVRWTVFREPRVSKQVSFPPLESDADAEPRPREQVVHGRS